MLMIPTLKVHDSNNFVQSSKNNPHSYTNIIHSSINRAHDYATNTLSFHQICLRSHQHHKQSSQFCKNVSWFHAQKCASAGKFS